MGTLSPLNTQGLNLYLVGMMGVGKSTTAQLLAPRFRYRTCDLDTEIESTAGCPIPEIFAQQGEATFRQQEAEALLRVATRSRLVVATGGGVILKDQNRRILAQGIVVWLDVDHDTLWQRLQADQSRPLLQTAAPYETIGHLLNQRAHLYADVADVKVQIQAGWCPSHVAKQVLEQLEQSQAVQKKVELRR